MKDTKYKVGEKVTVQPGKEHDGMGKGEVGEIVEISTPALGIKFPSMKEVHKWYVDAEVQPATATEKKASTAKQKPMKMMIARAAFDAMTPRERTDFCIAGGRLTDS